MLAYYLIRPVREALILTEGGAEFRSYAVAVQALLLILIVPAYSAWVRRMEPRRIYVLVNAFFVSHLLLFFLAGPAPAGSSASCSSCGEACSASWR